MGQHIYEVVEVDVGNPYDSAEIIVGNAYEPAEVSTNTNVIPGKSPYIDPVTNTWWYYDDSIQQFVDSGQLLELPVDGTEGQVLTKTVGGAEWRYFEGSVTEWGLLRNKPFESLDEQMFDVENGVLSINVTDDAVEGSMLPITSSGVNTIVGNINTLLSLI